jgi:hypothetical protein
LSENWEGSVAWLRVDAYQTLAKGDEAEVLNNVYGLLFSIQLKWLDVDVKAVYYLPFDDAQQCSE